MEEERKKKHICLSEGEENDGPWTPAIITLFSVINPKPLYCN